LTYFAQFCAATNSDKLSDPRYQILSRGRDAERCGLCYDAHHLWRVTVVVTLPETRPCVLRGKWDRLAQYQAILDIATSLSLNKLLGFGCDRTITKQERHHDDL